MVLYCDGISSMNDEQFRCFFELMPEERQKKALRYIKTEARQLNVAAYALLGYAFSLKGCKISNYEFAKNKTGKPYLINAALSFNISHTEDAVACVVSDMEIGVDIQKKVSKYMSVMNRVYSENEIELVSASKNPVDDFTKIWTLKESYVKCIGTGISNVISEYDFSDIVQNNGGKLYGYEFLTVDRDRYALSVCSKKPIEQIKKVSIFELYDFWKNEQNV